MPAPGLSGPWGLATPNFPVATWLCHRDRMDPCVNELFEGGHYVKYAQNVVIHQIYANLLF